MGGERLLSGRLARRRRGSPSISALRYEFNAPPYDADDRMRILNLTTLQLQQVGTNGVSRSGLHGDLNDVAPRVGVELGS